MTRERLGQSMIDDRKRVTLIKPVTEILNAKTGDYVFYELDSETGEIHVSCASLRKKPNNFNKDGCNKTTNPIQEVNGEEPNQTEGGGEFSSRNSGGGDEK